MKSEIRPTTRPPLFRGARAVVVTALLAALAGSPLRAAEWASWRGPAQNGISTETGLVSTWSRDGQNLIWRQDFTGRSTPVVFDGRVCAIGRVGTSTDKQEVVACWNAATGEKIWEHRANVYLTAVPFTRVGWANIEGDPETGYLYAHGVGGLLTCFDRAGRIVWQRSLTEEFGRISGYGGRTHSPIVDEDRLVLSFSSSGWGDQSPPRHRYFAFDKRTGDLVWVSAPGGRPETITTQATPVVAVINGTRLLIAPNGDGWIHAIKARTGEKVWSFQLSKQGLNNSVVVDGNRVFAASGDENLDEPTKGRVVCIDGTGTGDVTKTHEVWRANEIEAAFASPLFKDGRLYVLDDSANLFTIDAANGKVLWQFNLGTVGKGSPAWADGKIYATEVNGRVHIIRPGAEGAESLDMDELKMPDGRYAEIYASPAIAYGRLYIVSEEGIYCIGDPKKPFKAEPGPVEASTEPPPAPDARPARLQIVPAETTARPGDALAFKARSFDSAGRFLGEVSGSWALEGIKGVLDANGRLSVEKSAGTHAGAVVFRAGELTEKARVRVFAPLPWSEDFSAIEVGKAPAAWIGASNRFTVQEKEGNKVLAKPFLDQGLERSNVYIGLPSMSGQTVQADVMGSVKGRRRPDLGVISGGYIMDLMGTHQRLQIRDWEEPKFRETVPFSWEPDTWYTMKLRVEIAGDRAIVSGKVWKTGTPEPEAWTISGEDTVPIKQGSPGIYGYSAADIFYDNVKVTAK